MHLMNVEPPNTHILLTVHLTAVVLHLRSSSLITTLAVLSGPATTELAAAASVMEICALKSSSHSSAPSISLVTGIVTSAVVEPLLKVTVPSPPK